MRRGIDGFAVRPAGDVALTELTIDAARPVRCGACRVYRRPADVGAANRFGGGARCASETVGAAKPRAGRARCTSETVGAARRLPCDARSRGHVAELASFAALTALRQLRRVRARSALRARPRALRFSAPPTRRTAPCPHAALQRGELLSIGGVAMGSDVFLGVDVSGRGGAASGCVSGCASGCSSGCAYRFANRCASRVVSRYPNSRPAAQGA